MRIDLHCHSTASDGTWTPQQVADEAARRRLHTWSLTDHDSIDGWRQIADAPGLIVGCEISTLHRGREIHVVALGFDPEHPDLKQLLDRHVTTRRQRAQSILDHIAELRGTRLCLEDCQSDAAMITRSHIADALVTAGVVAHRQEAFHDLIGDNNVSRWHTPNYASPAEASAIVRAAGGVTILAHPGLYHDINLIDDIMRDLDGIEVKHPRLDRHLQSLIQRRATDHGWLLSAGSDFHAEPCRLGDWRLSRSELQPLFDAIGFSPLHPS